MKLLKETEEPVIKTATTYVISGSLTKEELDAVKAFCINPVDSREASETIPETLVSVFEKPEDVAVFEGFASMDEGSLKGTVWFLKSGYDLQGLPSYPGLL